LACWLSMAFEPRLANVPLRCAPARLDPPAPAYSIRSEESWGRPCREHVVDRDGSRFCTLAHEADSSVFTKLLLYQRGRRRRATTHLCSAAGAALQSNHVAETRIPARLADRAGDYGCLASRFLRDRRRACAFSAAGPRIDSQQRAHRQFALAPRSALCAPRIWERFDTLWYLRIAQHGYDRPMAVIFYPLYPAAIRIVSWVLPQPPRPYVCRQQGRFFLLGIAAPRRPQPDRDRANPHAAPARGLACQLCPLRRIRRS